VIKQVAALRPFSAELFCANLPCFGLTDPGAAFYDPLSGCSALWRRPNQTGAAPISTEGGATTVAPVFGGLYLHPEASVVLLRQYPDIDLDCYCPHLENS